MSSRLVVEGIEVIFDAEELARVPEKAVQREPVRHVLVRVRARVVPDRAVDLLEQPVGQDVRQNLLIAVFILDQSRAVVCRLRAALVERGQPELLEPVVSPVRAELFIVHAGEPLRKPVFHRLVPPRGPFDDRRAVDGLAAQKPGESFGVLHDGIPRLDNFLPGPVSPGRMCVCLSITACSRTAQRRSSSRCRLRPWGRCRCRS